MSDVDETLAGTGMSAEQLHRLGLGGLVPQATYLAQKTVERRARLCDEHGLSPIEAEYVDSHGLDPDEYVALKGVRNVTQYQRVRDELARRVAARAQAEQERLLEQERRRLGGRGVMTLAENDPCLRDQQRPR